MEKKKELSMALWVDEYRKELERRKCKAQTLRTHCNTAIRMMTYFDEKGVKSFQDVSSSDAESFAEWCAYQKPLTDKSKRTYYLQAFSFLSFLSKMVVGFPLPKAYKNNGIQTESWPTGILKYYKEFVGELEQVRGEKKGRKILNGIRKFCEFLVKNRGIEEIVNIESEDVKAFALSLSESTGSDGEINLATTSIARYLSCAKTFLKWLSKRGVCRGLSAFIRGIRRGEKLSRNILTRQEMKRLMEVETESPLEFMAKTVIVLLYATGIRATELLTLKIHHISVRAREAYIFEGKNEKERRVFLGDVGARYLELYMNVVRKQIVYGHTSDDLFPSMREEKRLTNPTVNKYLVRFCDRVKIDKKVTCHSLRHSFGTHLLENGLGLKQVSDLLGHNALKSTEKYTHLNPERLRRTILKYHPREV